MDVIANKWVEKIRKKKVNVTAPSYQSDPDAEYLSSNAKKPLKRYSVAARSVLTRTLRGVRR